MEKGCFPSIVGDRMKAKGGGVVAFVSILQLDAHGGVDGGGQLDMEGSALPTTESSPDVFPSTGAIDQQWRKIDQALEAEQLDELPCYF